MFASLILSIKADIQRTDVHSFSGEDSVFNPGLETEKGGNMSRPMIANLLIGLMFMVLSTSGFKRRKLT